MAKEHVQLDFVQNSFMLEDFKETRSAELQLTLVREDSSTASTLKSSAEMGLLNRDTHKRGASYDAHSHQMDDSAWALPVRRGSESQIQYKSKDSSIRSLQEWKAKRDILLERGEGRDREIIKQSVARALVIEIEDRDNTPASQQKYAFIPANSPLGAAAVAAEDKIGFFQSPFMLEDLKETRSLKPQPTLVCEDSSTESTLKSSAKMGVERGLIQEQSPAEQIYMPVESPTGNSMQHPPSPEWTASLGGEALAMTDGGLIYV